MTTLKEDERTKDAPLSAKQVVQLTPKEAFQLVSDEVEELVKDLDSVGQTTLSADAYNCWSALFPVA